MFKSLKADLQHLIRRTYDNGRMSGNPHDGTRHSTTTFYPNGGQERARRMRQIARGQLTASNGLVRGASFPKVNSHGQRA
jgi:hypothetical protein